MPQPQRDTLTEQHCKETNNPRVSSVHNFSAWAFDSPGRYFAQASQITKEKQQILLPVQDSLSLEIAVPIMRVIEAVCSSVIICQHAILEHCLRSPCNCTWTPSMTPRAHRSKVSHEQVVGNNSRSPIRKSHTPANSTPEVIKCKT